MGLVTLAMTAIIAATLFMGGDAISCYRCDSYSEEACLDKLNISSKDVQKVNESASGGFRLKDCKYCTKTKTYALGSQTVKRNCLTNTKSTELGCHTNHAYGTTKTACYCNTADCNHGKKVSASILMLMAMFIFQIIQ